MTSPAQKRPAMVLGPLTYAIIVWTAILAAVGVL
jgi:hypothetical protein